MPICVLGSDLRYFLPSWSILGLQIEAGTAVETSTISGQAGFWKATQTEPAHRLASSKVAFHPPERARSNLTQYI